MQDDAGCFVGGAPESNRKHQEIPNDDIKVSVVDHDICMGAEALWKPENAQHHVSNIAGC